MATFEPGRPITTKEPRISVDNPLKPGIYRFQLVVTDDKRRQSQPVFVAILALIVLQQIPVPREIVGGLFVIGGCLFVIRARKKKRR